MRAIVVLVTGLVFASTLSPQLGKSYEADDRNPEEIEAEVRRRVEKQVRAAISERWDREKKVYEQRADVLREEIARIDAAVQLDDKQKRRFELAIKGTVRRFTDSMQQAQVVEQDRTGHTLTLRNEVGSFHGGWPGHGLLQAESVWTKAVESTLTRDQLATYNRLAEARKAYLTKARVQNIVAALDDELWFTDEQRTAMEALLRKELKPKLKQILLSTRERAYFESRALAVDNEHFKTILTEKQMLVLENLRLSEWWHRNSGGGLGGGGFGGPGGGGGLF